MYPGHVYDDDYNIYSVSGLESEFFNLQAEYEERLYKQ
jgi:hypothetical protein